MPSPSPSPQSASRPAPGQRARSLARVAHQAAQAVSVLPVGAHGASRAPRHENVADLPAYVPVFASPDGEPKQTGLADRVISHHRAVSAAAPDAAAAIDLSASGIHLYAEKITGYGVERDALELWEHAARFGPGAVYAGMRSLSAAVLTARDAAGFPDHMVHLEALRRWWLVDWLADGDQFTAAGPADHHGLLAALARAVAACGDLDSRPREDNEVRARLWDAIAGPGPDANPLSRRQVAGRRIVLLDISDPYLGDRARDLPTWSPAAPDPEQTVLDQLPGDLQLRVEARLSASDRAVLQAYLAGTGTWSEAAAAAAPDGEDHQALGERVRRQLKRFGQESHRRGDARHVRVLDGRPRPAVSR